MSRSSPISPSLTPSTSSSRNTPTSGPSPIPKRWPRNLRPTSKWKRRGRCWRPIWRASNASRNRSSISWSTSIAICNSTSATPSAWSPACKAARKPLAASSAPAAIRPGSWCRSCGIWAWPRASSPAISSSSPPTKNRSTALPARKPTSPTCMHGPKFSCPAPVGSASTRLPACLPVKATSRLPARRIRPPPRRSPVSPTRARSTSSSATPSRASRKTRASPSPIPTSSGHTFAPSAAWSTPGCKRWTCA